MLPLTDLFLHELQPQVRREHPALVLVQHLRRDTELFIYSASSVGLRIGGVVGVEYSTEPDVLARLSSLAFPLKNPPLGDVESSLNEMLQHSAEPIIFCDVGGHCAGFARAGMNCHGIIEETRRGLWRYRQQTLSVPVIQLADSPLKAIEALYVGDAVGVAVADYAFQLGLGLRGLAVAVIGYGQIGRSAAGALRSRGARVACWDIDPLRLLQAATEGFDVLPRTATLQSASVIVGATGTGCLSQADLGLLRDSALLASASSQRIEFPVEAIARESVRQYVVSDSLMRFDLPSGTTVHLANQGFPVNFRYNSLPLQLGDLLFAQVAVAIERLLKNQMLPGGIHSLPIDNQRRIAARWLEIYSSVRF